MPSTVLPLLVTLLLALGCPTASEDFTTIGGTVTGLNMGNSVELQINGAQSITVPTDGSFRFDATLDQGDDGAYIVAIVTQPAGQTCDLTNNMGMTSGSNVTNIAVNCGTFSVTGTVSGVNGTVVLTNTTGSATTGSLSDGAFALDVTADGATFNIAVQTQPVGEICIVSDGSGTLSGPSDTTDVTVLCRITAKLFVGNRRDENFAPPPPLGPGNISTFSINPTTGELTAIGSLTDVGVSPRGIAVDPTGRFAYVTNSDVGANTVTALRINAVTGQLSMIAPDIATGFNPRRVLVDATGRFLYVGNFGTEDGSTPGSISIFSIDQGSGELTPVGAAVPSGGGGAEGFALHPSGRFAYASNFRNDNVTIFDVDPITGMLSEIATSSPFTVGNGPVSITVDPTGRFAFVTTVFDGTLEVYEIDLGTGTLVIPALPLMDRVIANNLTQPRWATVDARGRFVYVASESNDNIIGYTIDSISGGLAITPNGGILLGEKPRTVAVDPSGRFVFVQSTIDDTVTKFTIDQDTGNLIAPEISDTRDRFPESTETTPPARFAYVANRDSDDITTFRVDSVTGEMSPIGSPVVVGNEPQRATLDAMGRFLYVANRGSNNISILEADPLSGELTEIMASPIISDGTQPEEIVLGPTGRFAYVNVVEADKIRRFSVNASSGQLEAPTDLFATFDQPERMTFHPSGRFAYVPSTNIIVAFSVNSSGLLTEISRLDTFSDTSPSIRIHPSGRFAYLLRQFNNDLRVFNIDSVTGALSFAEDIGTGSNPFAITISRDGRFAYVLNLGATGIPDDGSMRIFAVNQLTGSLTQIGSDLALGDDPRSLTIDPTARFAYLAIQSTDEVLVFSINQADGTLTLVETVNLPANSGPFSVTLR